MSLSHPKTFLQFLLGLMTLQLARAQATKDPVGAALLAVIGLNLDLLVIVPPIVYLLHK